MTTDVIPYAERVGALSVQDVRSQVTLIQQVMRDVMKSGEHYGTIPGTNKPTLLKAGAEKLCLTFRLDPQYEIEQAREGVHLTITSKCTLFHIPSSQRFGSGMGSCSTRESKYAYRHQARKCPACGKEAIIKGKEEYGGGWVCFKKKEGCGAKYKDEDPAITGQPQGRVPNEDIADTYNTVLKMANKRSLVAAVLNATAASDIFTQDMEDVPHASAATDPDITEEIGKGSADVITADQHIVIMDELKGVANGEARLKKAVGVDRLTAIPAKDYARTLEWIKKAKEPKAAA